jgi:hypothetical protein
MGESKRRKALGLGSAKGTDWKKSGGYSLKIDWLDLGFERAVDWISNMKPEVIPQVRFLSIPETFLFVRQLLDRANTSPEWAAKRDKVATLIGASQLFIAQGHPLFPDELEFLEKAGRHNWRFENPETEKNFEDLRISSVSEAVAQ